MRLQFALISSVRLCSSKAPRPSRRKQVKKGNHGVHQKLSGQVIGSSELLHDFISSKEAEFAPSLVVPLRTKKVQLPQKCPGNVIKTRDLLKDFLDTEGKPEARLTHKNIHQQYSKTIGATSMRFRKTETLPEAEVIPIFASWPEPKPGLESGRQLVYQNQVFDEIEALERSLHRSKTTSNKFDELIQWTLDGKLWRYPIDNEQDWNVEKNTGFHDHVFLNRFIQDKEKKPAPLKAFLELVCAGLAQNPYASASDKREHIKWFEGYFANKVDQINAAVQEEKRLSDLETKVKVPANRGTAATSRLTQ